MIGDNDSWDSTMVDQTETTNSTNDRGGEVGFKSITMPVYMILLLVTPFVTAMGSYYGMSNEISLVKKDVLTVQQNVQQSTLDSKTFRDMLQQDIIKVIDLRISELKNEIASSNNKAFNDFNQTLFTLKQDIQQMQGVISQVSNSYKTIQTDQEGLERRISAMEDQLREMQLELAKIEANLPK